MDKLHCSLNEIFEGITGTISNPPYGAKWEQKETDLMKTIGAVPPKGKADYAFVLDCFEKIKKGGESIFVLSSGVLFSSNKDEYVIRKWLVDNGFIKAVIFLPGNMFEATNIATIILVLSKSVNKDVILIDSINNCIKESRFRKGSYGSKCHMNRTYEKKVNALSDENIDKILQALHNGVDVEDFCYVVSKEQIIQNDYNLNINIYKKIECEPIKYPPSSEILENLIEMSKSIEMRLQKLKKMI